MAIRKFIRLWIGYSLSCSLAALSNSLTLYNSLDRFAQAFFQAGCGPQPVSDFLIIFLFVHYVFIPFFETSLNLMYLSFVIRNVFLNPLTSGSCFCYIQLIQPVLHDLMGCNVGELVSFNGMKTIPEICHFGRKCMMHECHQIHMFIIWYKMV